MSKQPNEMLCGENSTEETMDSSDPQSPQSLSPVLAEEEYIEQAFFFRTLRERIQSGIPTQEVLEHLLNELLSSTQLLYAAQFMFDELKHSGELGVAFGILPHYFTPLQALIVSRAEDPKSQLTFSQALRILEREAQYRAADPSVPGLFIFQLETLSRNRLGYPEGLQRMQRDEFYTEPWREYIGLVRQQLGAREFSSLIFSRSQWYVIQRRRADPDFEPNFEVLFGEREGKIAAANQGKDPMFLFATLQRQLGYPQVPRLPRADPRKNELEELNRKIKILQTRLLLVEVEVLSKDPSQLLVEKEDGEGGKNDQ